MNLFLVNTLPECCPYCTKRLFKKLDTPTLNDFYAMCAHHCLTCGAMFQYVPKDKILVIADDLKYYVNKEN